MIPSSNSTLLMSHLKEDGTGTGLTVDLARPPLEAGMVEVRDGAGEGAFACHRDDFTALLWEMDKEVWLLQMRQKLPLSTLAGVFILPACPSLKT